MADGVDVHIVNGPAFTRMLEGIISDLRESREPITAVGDALTPAARANAPKGETGNLAAAHAGAFNRPGVFRITVDTPYAAPLHWGWPAHGIRRRPWITATWLRNQDAYLERMTAAQQTALDREAAKT